MYFLYTESDVHPDMDQWIIHGFKVGLMQRFWSVMYANQPVCKHLEKFLTWVLHAYKSLCKTIIHYQNNAGRAHAQSCVRGSTIHHSHTGSGLNRQG